MSRIEKLLIRFLSCPCDFDWNELLKLMGSFDYEWKCSTGSHGAFVHPSKPMIKPATRPHGGRTTIPMYQLKQYKEALISYGFIDPEEDL